MHSPAGSTAAVVLGALFAATLAGGPDRAAAETLTGTAAFGGWRDSHPGQTRLIRPGDMPAPHATRSSSNAPGLSDRPAGAVPRAMAGFSVSAFASGLDTPRVIRVAPNGDVFVADSGSGRIHAYRIDAAGRIVRQTVFASGLSRPYGMAFYPNGDAPSYLYVAESGRVLRYAYAAGRMKAQGAAQVVVGDLPTGGHWTRDLAFAPDGETMFVSVGSASNAGRGSMSGQPPEGFVEESAPGAAWGGEQHRAAVLAFDPDGGNRRVYATGLRNCSGMTVQPATGDLWCVVNERDSLGDNLPPDYATIVRKDHFYGWPWFYIGGNADPRWKKAPRADLKDKVTVPDVLFQAHSAPLGIAFYTGGMFPAEFRGDAFATMHGSWNRGRRTGYKVVRLIFRDGKPTGAYQDFLTGFVIDADRVWGRPVGVAVLRDGSLLVSDDGSGTLWRVTADR